MQNAAEACCQPLNVPLRSLKRSSPCDARAAEIGVDEAVAVATGLVAGVAEATWVATATGVEDAGTSDVSEPELPHNFRTVEETG